MPTTDPVSAATTVGVKGLLGHGRGQTVVGGGGVCSCVVVATGGSCNGCTVIIVVDIAAGTVSIRHAAGTAAAEPPASAVPGRSVAVLRVVYFLGREVLVLRPQYLGVPVGALLHLQTHVLGLAESDDRQHLLLLRESSVFVENGAENIIFRKICRAAQRVCGSGGGHQHAWRGLGMRQGVVSAATAAVGVIGVRDVGVAGATALLWLLRGCLMRLLLRRLMLLCVLLLLRLLVGLCSRTCAGIGATVGQEIVWTAPVTNAILFRTICGAVVGAVHTGTSTATVPVNVTTLTNRVVGGGQLLGGRNQVL